MSMKKLALAAIATVFVASAYAAQPAPATPAPEQLSAETLTPAQCEAKVQACNGNQACIEALPAECQKPKS